MKVETDVLVRSLKRIRALGVQMNNHLVINDAAELEEEVYRLRAIEDAARLYIEECENPAPDLLYRRTLRDRLSATLRGDL